MMVHRAACFAIASLAALACSTTNVTNVYGTSDSGTNDGGEDATSTDSGDASEGPDASADAVADAGAPDPQSYWPLAIGLSWGFSATGMGCSGDTFRVASVMTIAGKSAFVTDESCPHGNLGSCLAANPDHTVDNIGPPCSADADTWRPYLPSAPSGQWVSVASVTVPAGTFSDCIKLGSGTIFRIFCRGVGPVDFAYVDVGQPVEFKLVSKSF